MRKDWHRGVFWTGVGVVILACWIGWWAVSGFPAPICPGESARGCLSFDLARNWVSQAADAAWSVAELANRWAALIVALFTAVLAFFTNRLWWSTDKLWSVTNRTLQHAQEASRKELRAYISVEPLGISEYVGQNYLIGHFRIRNLGKIPAKDVSVYSTIDLDMDGKRTNFTIGTSRLSRTVLHPGAEMEFGSYEGWEIPADQLDSNEPLKVRGYLYVWGEVLYTDEFKTAGWTAFCHRYPCDMFGVGHNEAFSQRARNHSIDRSFARYHEEAGNEAG